MKLKKANNKKMRTTLSFHETEGSDSIGVEMLCTDLADAVSVANNIDSQKLPDYLALENYIISNYSTSVYNLIGGRPPQRSK